MTVQDIKKYIMTETKQIEQTTESLEDKQIHQENLINKIYHLLDELSTKSKWNERFTSITHRMTFECDNCTHTEDIPTRYCNGCGCRMENTDEIKLKQNRAINESIKRNISEEEVIKNIFRE